MERAERDLFERAVDRAVTGRSGAALDRELVELGWSDALADDPEAAVSVLFSRLGRANASSAALAQVVSAGLGLDPRQVGPALLPALGSSAPPARLEGAPPPGAAATAQIDALSLGPLDADGSDRLVVAAADGLISVAAADLAVEPVAGLDPGMGLYRVTADRVRFQPIRTGRAGPGPETGPARPRPETGAARPGPETGPAGPGPETGSWAEAVAWSRRAVGHELAGAARAMVELARGHALERVQFDRPIARFQAVRHRLAEALVAVEGADSLLAAAWEDPSAELSAAAKAVAGRAGRTAARHAQQVLAGIGFTAEHPFHRYLRRVIVLDQLFGTSRTLTSQLGDQILEAGKVPGLLPL